MLVVDGKPEDHLLPYAVDVDVDEAVRRNVPRWFPKVPPDDWRAEDPFSPATAEVTCSGARVEASRVMGDAREDGYG